MHLFLKHRLASTSWKACAMAASLAVALGAQAADGHGDASHDEPRSSGARASASRSPEIKLPGKPAPLRKGGDKASGKYAEDPEAESAKRETAPEVKTTVSMSELRDLIDQKIAEVRAQRQPAPVVRLRPKAKPVAKKPAAEQHASLGPATSHDAHGALLPLPGDHGHAHDTAGAGRAVNPLGRDVHWAYSGDTGPDNWGRLKPEFQLCGRGKRQSPIDIRDGIAVQLDPIQFDYRPSGFRVIDNGHTVQVNVEPGNAIVVHGNRYELQQFHFHRPSEERINGRQFEMVAHLVHKDLDGRLAVVAVLMDAGKGHPLVQQVWNNLPLEKRIEQAGLTPMDLTLLLPAQRQYYTYMGSLTTPPCSEGVLWMVMKHPATVSREQIAVFGKLYPMNARPIQSASGRLIKEGQ